MVAKLEKSDNLKTGGTNENQGQQETSGSQETRRNPAPTPHGAQSVCGNGCRDEGT